MGPVFSREGVSFIISRVEVRRGLLESNTGRQAKRSLFTDVVLDFQIIFIFRTCGLFLGANVNFLG